MSKVIPTILTVAVMLPLTIVVISYCLEPQNSATNMIGLGCLLVVGSLVILRLLNKNDHNLKH